MVLGNFEDDLNFYLSKNSSPRLASKKSNLDLLEVGINSNGRLGLGKMYCFKYFSPYEKFYDRFPIVLGLGSAENDNQIGINLHYIPYEIRLEFIRKILKAYENFFDLQRNLIGKIHLQKENSFFNYDAIKGYLQGYNFSYAIKQYKLERMIEPKDIGYENWYIGVVHDENYFFGGNITQAQDAFFK
jgi:hypothetical protein